MAEWFCGVGYRVDWNAVSAIATAIGVLVALGVPTYLRYEDRKMEIETRDEIRRNLALLIWFEIQEAYARSSVACSILEPKIGIKDFQHIHDAAFSSGVALSELSVVDSLKDRLTTLSEKYGSIELAQLLGTTASYKRALIHFRRFLDAPNTGPIGEQIEILFKMAAHIQYVCDECRKKLLPLLPSKVKETLGDLKG